MAKPAVRTRLAVALGGLVLAACQQHAVRGVALYPGDPLRARTEVALLSGPVESVDGRNVGSLGTLLELLPGCHVIELGGRVGLVGERESLAAISGGRVYALRMRAGHTYTVEVPRELRSERWGQRVVVREEDRNGHVAFVPAALSSSDIAACRQWTPDARSRVIQSG